MAPLTQSEPATYARVVILVGAQTKPRLLERRVDPFKSLKRIVTVFRTSGGAGAAASGVPQKPQSRNRSGFSSPQFGQRTITPVRGYLPADVVCPDPAALPGPDIAPRERLDLTLLRVSENGMQQCVVVSGFTGGSYGLDR